MESKTRLATFALAYGISIATIYLWTYWGSFGINAFEYASISDVAARAILPVAAGLLPLVASSGFVEISPLVQLFPPGGGRNSRFGIFVNKHARLIVGLSVLAGLVILSTSNKSWRWWAAILFFTPIVPFLENHPLTINLFPEDRSRRILVTAGIFSVFASAGTGDKNAEKILSGNSERVIDTASIGIPLKASPNNPVEYIGYMGGTYFLYETQTKSVIILKQNDHDAIVLKPKKKAE
ncbi:hypothetical protein [Burkholderia gladioli]|uniref:hypothetical protein n=1 Tax=Burkholderia gladioli TaxID=28095 RepID=UPI002FE2BE66